MVHLPHNHITLKEIEIILALSSNVTETSAVIPTLVHGDIVINVATKGEEVGSCDGLVTQNRELSLAIKTADCAPICFGDGRKIGIAHVGWRGLCLQLIEKMLIEFDSKKLEVYVGPRLDIFEIQKDSCYDAIHTKFGEQFFTMEGDKIMFHFKDALASCLPQHTIFDERSTGTDFSLPSYRRNGTSERLLTIVQFSK